MVRPLHCRADSKSIPPPVLSDLTCSRPPYSAMPDTHAHPAPTPYPYPTHASPPPYPHLPRVTVFGFTPEDNSLVLREFQSCGRIVTYGAFAPGRVNWRAKGRGGSLTERLLISILEGSQICRQHTMRFERM